MPLSFWYNNVMYCTTREAARFGSLILRKGVWNSDTLLRDQNYFTAMTNTSQPLNNAYGYLWWLNGKNSFMRQYMIFQNQFAKLEFNKFGKKINGKQSVH